MRYVDSPLVSLTTMFLIVMGGLGFPVWHDIFVTAKKGAGGKRREKANLYKAWTAEQDRAYDNRFSDHFRHSGIFPAGVQTIRRP